MSESFRNGTPDAENPEWTDEKFAHAQRFSQLPERMQAALKRTGRGPQKAPTKAMVTLRLSQDVLAALRATGPGWQTTADEALRRAFVKPC